MSSHILGMKTNWKKSYLDMKYEEMCLMKNNSGKLLLKFDGTKFCILLRVSISATFRLKQISLSMIDNGDLTMTTFFPM